MGKAKTNRLLRKIAKDQATDSYKTTNEDMEIKTVKGDKLVLHEGQYVYEDLPKVVFNTKLVDGCARKIYKEMKREVRNGDYH